MKVNIYDVANAAGCSPMTVSRALRNDSTADLVRPARRKKIIQIAQRLGYRANPLARGLALRRTFNVGFCINYSTFFYSKRTFNPINRAMQNQLDELGYQLGFYFFERDQDQRFVRFLSHPLTVDSITFLGRNSTEAELKTIRDSGIKALSLLKVQPGIASIYYQEVEAGRLAAQTLFQYGHRRVGVIWRSIGQHNWDGRFHGFMDEAQQLGLSINIDAICEVPPATGYAGLDKDFDSVATATFDRLPWRQLGLTAIYTTSDSFSMPIIKRMDALGLRPGVDLSLLAYDNFEEDGHSPWPTPRIAAICPQRRLLGQKAAQFLAGKVAQPDDQGIPIPPRFISRESLQSPHN